jgi:hypothetical protein
VANEFQSQASFFEDTNYFTRQNPIGKKLWLFRLPTEIIGVVWNGHTDDLTQAAESEIYLSLWEATAFSKHLVVRARPIREFLLESDGR